MTNPGDAVPQCCHLSHTRPHLNNARGTPTVLPPPPSSRHASPRPHPVAFLRCCHAAITAPVQHFTAPCTFALLPTALGGRHWRQPLNRAALGPRALASWLFSVWPSLASSYWLYALAKSHDAQCRPRGTSPGGLSERARVSQPFPRLWRVSGPWTTPRRPAGEHHEHSGARNRPCGARRGIASFQRARIISISGVRRRGVPPALPARGRSP